MLQRIGITLMVLLSMVTQAKAGVILPDRAALNALLGGSATTETFETINLGLLPSRNVGSALDASTVIPAFGGLPAQGPGVVVGGITFSPMGAGNSLAVIKNACCPAFDPDPTQVLRTTDNAPLVITFSQPVTAFGLDLIFNSGNTQATAITILGSDNTTVLQTDSKGLSGGQGQAFFFGVSEPGMGIGRVRFAETLDGIPTAPFFVTIDNLTFGNAIPEPSTWLLLGSGFVALALARRKLSV